MLILTSGDYNTFLGGYSGSYVDTGEFNIMVGYGAEGGSGASNAIAIGGYAAAAFSDSIAIGYDADTTAANQLVIGSPQSPITNVYIGENVTSTTPQDVAINVSGASGTNQSGADLILAGGKGTGNAAGGDIVFSTSDAGGSGSTLQSLSEKVRITNDGYLGVGTSTPSAKLAVSNPSRSVEYEGFENVTFPPGTWTTGGDTSFSRSTSVYQDGAASAASGTITSNQTSYLQYTRTYTNAGTVKFYWRVSSEKDYDYLLFCLDNDSCTSASGYTKRISGETGWIEVTVQVVPGTHSFRWVYSKDVAVDSGSDKGWVDNVRFTENFSNDDLVNVAFGAESIFNINAYGNIGINTSTTSALLQLNSGSQAIAFTSDGKIGIGTTAPSALLDVVGRINISDSNDNVFVTGGNDTLTGNYNSILGLQAGEYLTTGYENTLMGYRAGASMVDEYLNTFIGYKAGENTTGGFGASYNTFIGGLSGSTSTGGTENTAVGYYSGYNFQSGGADNVALGFSAGQTVSTGSDNVTIGAFADVNSGTYSSGIALGSNAFIGASNSIAIGYGATTTASNQLVIGDNTSPITDFYIGEGVTAGTPGNITINATGGSGTNNAGADLILAGGKATGNAAGGDIIFSTSNAGSSGSTLQSLTEKFRITNAGAIGLSTTYGSTGDCLKSGGSSTAAVTWGACSAGASYFTVSGDGKAIIQGNTTMDLILGGTATSSAKFAFTNMISGNPTLNIYDSSSTNYLSLYNDGTDSYIKSNTGELVLGTGTGGIIIEDAITNDTTNNAGVVRVSDKFLVQNTESAGNALAIFNNTGAGDIFTASNSGTTRFTIEDDGQVGLASKLKSIGGNVTNFLDLEDDTVSFNGEDNNTVLDSIGTIFIAHDDNNNDFGNFYIGNGNSDPGGTNWLTEFSILASTGDVGIGTATPETRLQVTGGGLCVGSDANCNTDNDTEGVVYSSSTSMTAYDVAEQYPTKDTTIVAGEVITMDPNNDVFVVRSSTPYDPRAIGAISTAPGVLLGGFNGAQFRNEHQVNVALSGRIPVKASTENGIIQQGDFVTTSSTPGKIMKATRAGYVIGQALGDYNASTGTVMVFVNTHYHDPDVYMTSSGNLSIAVDPQQAMGIVTNNGQAVGRISAFAESFIGNLFAGLIEADKVTTDSLVVNTGDVTIDGKSLDQYIADIAGSGSPSATVDVNQINNFDAEVQNRIDQTLLTYGSFTVETGSTSAQILAQLVAQAQAQSEGASANTVLTTDVLLAGFEIVTPKLTADEINVGKLRANQIEGLDVLVGNLNVAQISDLRSRLDELMQATRSASGSGTLETATASAEETTEERIARLLTEDATRSASPTNILTLGSIDVAGVATVSGDLKVKGNSIVSGILTVLDTLNVGDVLVTGVSNFLGETIFGDKVQFNDQVKFSDDTAGVIIVNQGQATVDVVFNNEFDSVPLVTASLVAEGTASQKQAVLSAGYNYAVTDVTATGFTIQLNKSALTNVKFSWVAIQTNGN